MSRPLQDLRQAAYEARDDPTAFRRLVKHQFTLLYNYVRGVLNLSLVSASFAFHQPHEASRRLKAWISRNLITVPVLLTILWMPVLRWGEISVFDQGVNSCNWSHWENWPARASPHHLIFVADPQLVDPHTYPGRPWPLSTLTVKHTDVYLRRAYSRIQQDLDPNTIIFLGDLFDGGREWSTTTYENPNQRWRKYDDSFWLKEYNRFSRIFFRDWTHNSERIQLACEGPSEGIRILASLPGNHDLGFGTGISVSVRDRFNAYFGDSNRVDVIGNHTFVSLDTVSLSAKEQDTEYSEHDIWAPPDVFLSDAQANIARTYDRYFSHIDDFEEDPVPHHLHEHIVEDVEFISEQESVSNRSSGRDIDFPLILLSHVPLHRSEGTPCGPLREKHPPTKRPHGQEEPVDPDPANAIRSGGYGEQYQNVLSFDLTRSIVENLDGKIEYAFSGDDHDYCEVVHRAYPSPGSGIREITVKSLSWAMGVRKPGFVMAGLWNEVDEYGKKLPRREDESKQTLQTHLCLLPDQLAILIRYGLLFGISIILLLGRSISLVFTNSHAGAQGASSEDGLSLLPTHRIKGHAKESPRPDGAQSMDDRNAYHAAVSATSDEGRNGSTSLLARNANATRPRSTSPLPAYGLGVGSGLPSAQGKIMFTTREDGVRKKDDDAEEETDGPSSHRRRHMKHADWHVAGRSKLTEILWEFWRQLWSVARVVIPWYLWLLRR